jgi:hypothetical protein
MAAPPTHHVHLEPVNPGVLDHPHVPLPRVHQDPPPPQVERLHPVREGDAVAVVHIVRELQHANPERGMAGVLFVGVGELVESAGDRERKLGQFDGRWGVPRTGGEGGLNTGLETGCF